MTSIRAVRAKDLKRLLDQAQDDDVLVFQIVDESAVEAVRFTSDVADVATLCAVRESAQQTSDGDADVFKISLVLDLG